ncbi:MlaD family protein [Kamptonema formosum]|uniref:MlaD family protein n=1 Tax=Kamptonema formosum TaxID=331992 RepID=UPI00034DCF01|nr:MlaD family protein [Oscillatoria sp. PCC 10802]
MRSRTVREGSVGLLLVLGLSCFGALVFWLGGLTLGKKSYTVVVEFQDAGGMQEGAPVRYRGVEIGQITEIKPGANGVDVTIQISPADLVIPRPVEIEATESGLIGESSIDIRPLKTIPDVANVAKPLDRNCNKDLIVCDKSRLQGQPGVSFDELIRSTVQLTRLITDPVFFQKIESLATNAASATGGVAKLTGELSGLTQTVRQELKSFSTTANSLAQTADRMAVSVDRTSTKVGDSLERVSNQVGAMTVQIGSTAGQLGATAAQMNRLTANVNDLVVSNRSTLVATLNNISQTSAEMGQTLRSLRPVLNQVEQGELVRNLDILSANAAAASTRLRDLSEGQFIRNLEDVSANAAAASANLRQLSDPANLVMLQQTLDSARATFQNAQKITSDLDELTGDPSFRTNIKRLVNGLSGLVSSTQLLEQQTQLAQSLAPLSAVMDAQASAIAGMQLKKQMPAVRPPAPSSAKIPEGHLAPWGRPPVAASMAQEPVAQDSAKQMTPTE